MNDKNFSTIFITLTNKIFCLTTHDSNTYKSSIKTNLKGEILVSVTVILNTVVDATFKNLQSDWSTRMSGELYFAKKETPNIPPNL